MTTPAERSFIGDECSANNASNESPDRRSLGRRQHRGREAHDRAGGSRRRPSRGRVIESFQTIASAKEISLVGETLAESIVAKFDHQRILQVLGNLLTNALRFTPQRGRVSVRAERMRSDNERKPGFQFRIPGPVSQRIAWRRSSSAMNRGGMPTEMGWASVSISLGRSWRPTEANLGRELGERKHLPFHLPDRPSPSAPGLTLRG